MIFSFYHWFHTGSDTNSELKNRVNYHYATNILINYIDIDTTFNYNLSTEALTNDHWSIISSNNTAFFNLNILDDSRYIVLGEGATAQLDWHHYYNNELPPQSDSTYSVTKSLFGNGFPTHIKYTENQLNIYRVMNISHPVPIHWNHVIIIYHPLIQTALM